MQISKWLNKHLFFIILVSCLAIMVAAGTSFLNASDDGTLYIQDMEGDRSVLDNVVISGLIQDRSHGITFDIRNLDVDKRFSYYNSNQDIDFKIMGLKTSDVNYSYQLDYVISPDANMETTETKEINESGYTINKISKVDAVDFYVRISRIDYSNAQIDWSDIRFNPGAGVRSDTLEFEFTSIDDYDKDGVLRGQNGGSDLGHGLVVYNPQDAFTLLDGHLYFTLLSAPQHSGNNGIYKVERFADQWERMSDLSDEWEIPDENAWKRAQYGNVKPITTFSLDEQNMSVLAIEAVNGKLILIVIENNTLILRSYHPETGKLMDELPVQELNYEDYQGTLQAFIDGSILNLNIVKKIKEEDDQFLLSNILLSVDIADKLSLLHHVENLQLESGEIAPQYIDQMVTADQKLFVFAGISREEEQQEIAHDVLRPKHNLVFVYGGDEFLYKGEFMTDIDEDYITYRERMRGGGSFGYDPNQFRQIYGYQVEGRE